MGLKRLNTDDFNNRTYFLLVDLVNNNIKVISN